MGNENARPSAPQVPQANTLSQRALVVQERLPAYTMKVVLRGARKTGKTALMLRLQGKPFQEEYVPTPEIQTCSINWTYKNSEDRIKVEVWDVVDSILLDEQPVGKVDDDDAPAGFGPASVPAFNTSSRARDAKLDADHIDVYKGAHAVVVLFDPANRKTWDYVKQTVPKVPSKLPVLILANFRDVAHDGKRISLRDVEKYASEMSDGGSKHAGRWQRVQALECSLRDCYGLKVLYNFFNIPFLELKIASTIADLETAKEELQAYFQSQDYEEYRKWRVATSVKPAAPEPSAFVSPGAIRSSGMPPDEYARQSGRPSTVIAADLPRTRGGSSAVPSDIRDAKGASHEKTAKKKDRDRAPSKPVRKDHRGRHAPETDSDSDEQVAGLASIKAPARTMPAARGQPTAGKDKGAVKGVDDIDLGGNGILDSFLGDDDDDDNLGAADRARQADRQWIAQLAKPDTPSSGSSRRKSESAESEDSDSRAPPPQPKPAQHAATSAQPRNPPQPHKPKSSSDEEDALPPKKHVPPPPVARPPPPSAPTRPSLADDFVPGGSLLTGFLDDDDDDHHVTGIPSAIALGRVGPEDDDDETGTNDTSSKSAPVTAPIQPKTGGISSAALAAILAASQAALTQQTNALPDAVDESQGTFSLQSDKTLRKDKKKDKKERGKKDKKGATHKKSKSAKKLSTSDHSGDEASGD